MTSPRSVRWLAILLGLAGLWLILAPFLFGYAVRAAVFHDVVVGLLVVGLGGLLLLGRLAPMRAKPAGLVLGLWLLGAPFLLGYAEMSGAFRYVGFWNDAVVGALALLLGRAAAPLHHERSATAAGALRPLLPVAVAVVMGFIIASGLLFTLREGLVVAPKAERAHEGRLLMHNKNVTRLVGDASAVGRQAWEAAYLEDAPALPGGSWRERAEALVTAKRRLAGRVHSLGNSPAAFVLRAWEGGGFNGLDHHLPALAAALEHHPQRHLANPVIHYFHATNRRTALGPAVAVLDEALLLHAEGLTAHFHPASAILEPTRRTVAGLLDTLGNMFIEPAPSAPAPPALGPLCQARISVVEEAAFVRSVSSHEDRRRLLRGFVEDGGWGWSDVAGAETVSASPEGPVP